MRRTRMVLLALGLSSALLAAACGDDAEDTAATGDSPTTEETTTTTAAEGGGEGTETETETETGTEGGDTGDGAAGGETIEIVGVNYAYENVPETIAAGSMLAFRNAAEDEAHELVAIRIPDEETRPIEELVQLPEEELFGVFGGEPEPATVLIAGPGDEGTAVAGDGTLSEPGRYAFLCFIPVGSDPAVIMDPNSDPSPQSDAPPHAAQGMVAEVTVE